MSRWRRTSMMPCAADGRERATTWSSWRPTYQRPWRRRARTSSMAAKAGRLCSSPRCTTGSSRPSCLAWSCGAWAMTSRSAICHIQSLDTNINAFDLRRQDLYTRRVLEPLKGVIDIVSLLDLPPAEQLPEELLRWVETSAAYDTMYREQVERFRSGIQVVPTALAQKSICPPERTAFPENRMPGCRAGPEWSGDGAGSLVSGCPSPGLE